MSYAIISFVIIGIGVFVLLANQPSQTDVGASGTLPGDSVSSDGTIASSDVSIASDASANASDSISQVSDEISSFAKSALDAFNGALGLGLTSEQSSIASLVQQYAQQYGLDATIELRQAQAESNFNPDAVGPSTRYGTAKGVMQLIDSTAQEFGVTNPFDPVQNIEAGIKYMRQLLDEFSGDYRMALAAYNWGPGNLKAALKEFNTNWFLNAPIETQNYVNKIIGV